MQIAWTVGSTMTPLNPSNIQIQKTGAEAEFYAWFPARF